jgi:hypothetical protein
MSNQTLSRSADCAATQHNDQMMCPCGLAWDVNDPEPPMCQAPKKKARSSNAPVPDAVQPVERRALPLGATSSSLSRERVHSHIQRLIAQLGASHAAAHAAPKRHASELDMLIEGKTITVSNEEVAHALNRPGRVVLCAAVSMVTCEGRVLFIGPRHFDGTMRRQMERYMRTDHAHEDGFIDQWGVFMSREEALIVAWHAGQLGRRPKTHPFAQLFSEDLY